MTSNVKIVREQGGNQQTFGSGSTLQVDDGAVLKVDGVDVTDEVAALDGMTADATDMNYLDGVTPGTVVLSKAVIADANKDIASFRNHGAVNYDAGSSGVAGTVDVFPTTALKGKTTFTAADNAGDTTTTVTTAAQAGARTYTVPDAGASAGFVMTQGAQTINDAKTFGTAPALPQTFCTVDGVSISPLKWVDVTVTAALLDAAGSVNVIAGVAGDQYKVRDVRLIGGGTSFAAGGDRLIDLTDGTTVYTTIANADIESAPAATLAWGNAKVPFLTGTADTSTASAAALRFQYSGGTTDHSATGSIKFSVCIQKVA